MKDSKILLKFAKYSYKAYPGYYWTIIIQSLFNTALSIFNIYSLSIIIDSLIAKSYQECLIIGAIIVGINFIFYFINKIFKRIIGVAEPKLMQKINQMMAVKLMNVDFATLEDPYYLDLKERAKFACDNQGAVQGMLYAIKNAIEAVISIISLSTIIITFSPLIIVAIIISVSLSSLIMIFNLKYQLKFYADLLPINRRYGYYITTLWQPTNAKDYRLFNTKDLMITKFLLYEKQVVKYFGQASYRFAFYNSLSNIVNYLQMFAIYAFVAYKTVTSKLLIGAFSLYVNSAMKLSTSISTLIEQGVELKRYIEYLKPFIELMDLPVIKDSGKRLILGGEISKIEFKHVSFSYPHSDNLVLNDISFQINKGEKISIVGLNGAGKTTMVKLICRLYHPTSGQILINDIDIFDYDYDHYLKEISAVFQDFKLFAYSLSENITGVNDKDDEATDCAKKVGLTPVINKLPKGIKSIYSKEYDEEGIQLSGGETQKVAIARALYKDSSLIILDEPTSALDPLAEADIYNNFNNLVKEKTAIYISHRMSSSVFCDKVLIIDGGKIADFDTHQNLMKKTNSLYYKLFTSQAVNYQI